MRQARWESPGRRPSGFAYDFGALVALVALVVGGRVLLAGMYCTTDGFRRIDLRDAATGEVLGVDGTGGKERWREPADHFSAFTWQRDTYLLHVTDRPNGYRVLRATLSGLELVERTLGNDDFFTTVAATVLDGRPAIMAGDFEGVRFRRFGAGEQVLRSWTPPDEWSCSGVLSAGGRSYAWLHHNVPEETPPEESRRLAAEHGRRLWDVTADTPGPPLLVRGYEWGPWDLAGRPVILFKVDWRDFQVWDLARREPLGPGLGDLDLTVPSVGSLYGRPALAAASEETLTVWDVATGRSLGSAALPEPTIATTIGPNGTAWAIGRAGHVASLTIPAGHVHPSAVRRAARVSPLSPRRSP